MGFFTESRTVCYEDMSMLERLEQYAYNIGATLVGTVAPSAFDKIGVMSIPGQFGVRGFLLPALVGIAAVAAVSGGPARSHRC